MMRKSDPANPTLVEVFRGTLVESRHAGAIAVADADGGLLFAFGDVERPVFPRSAVKAMQAMPLVESGAADAFGLGDDELAVACASHSGELAHVEAVRSLLAKAGLDESYLACGAHWPISEEASRELIRVGRRPQAIHNNCSGKHAGMLAACIHLDFDPRGYARPEHPLQSLIAEPFQRLAESRWTRAAWGSTAARCRLGPRRFAHSRAASRGSAQGRGLRVNGRAPRSDWWQPALPRR